MTTNNVPDDTEIALTIVIRREVFNADSTEKVKNYLLDNGFTIDRQLVRSLYVTGTAAEIRDAFQTQLVYQEDGVHAPNSPVDARDVQSLITVLGLNNRQVVQRR